MSDLAWLERYQPVDECVIRHVPTADILCDYDFNCRGQFTLQSVSDLAASIRQNTLLTPVIVQPWKDPPLRLIAGFRRFTACAKVLRLKTIKATICVGLNELQARVINLAENLDRKDLNIVQEAKGLLHTFRDSGLSYREIAKRMCEDFHWVRVRYKLLELPERVQELAATKRITHEDIRTIWKMPTEARQIQIAERIAKRGPKSRRYLPPECRSSFRPRKTKAELREMVSRMLDAGLEDTGPRVAVWASGLISDKELWRDVKNQLRIQKQVRDVLTVCPPQKRKK